MTRGSPVAFRAQFKATLMIRHAYAAPFLVSFLPTRPTSKPWTNPNACWEATIENVGKPCALLHV